MSSKLVFFFILTNLPALRARAKDQGYWLALYITVFGERFFRRPVPQCVFVSKDAKP